MTKSEFTKQKNRISAQLSRERREAIMHSLISVCINNIKAKKELDADIEEVKQVLKESLWGSCNSNLRGVQCSSEKPSTLHIKASGDKEMKDINEKKSISAISVSRPGTWGLLMSFAVIAWVLGVALISPEDSKSQITGGVVPAENFPLRQLREINLEPVNAVAYLNPSDIDNENKINGLIR